MSVLWMLLAIGIADTNQLRVVVNIPAYRVDAYVADSVVFTAPVAVGRAEYRTPRGAFTINSVEWNPWWIPPDQPWARNERPMPPGPENWMGRVKINFRPLYFLHGTPFETSLGSAASHGCIRMRNDDAVVLARLVHRFGTPDLSADDVTRLERGAETRLVALVRLVPLEVRYDRVELQDDRVVVYRDVYGVARESLPREVMRTLAAGGIDTTRVDASRLRALTTHVGPRGRSSSVSDLLRPRSREE